MKGMFEPEVFEPEGTFEPELQYRIEQITEASETLDYYVRRRASATAVAAKGAIITPSLPS
jgi:hypothetical protein